MGGGGGGHRHFVFTTIRHGRVSYFWLAVSRSCLAVVHDVFLITQSCIPS